MNPEETMVETQIDDIPADDAPVEDVVEETDESESLESISEDAGSAENPPEEEVPASEPGWIKKRVEKAVNKAVTAALAKQQAEFERQMAPLRERALNEEARELVRQGEFKSLDRAKEYLQLKQGMMPVADAEPKQQPRNAKGQYAAPQDDPVISARIDLLTNQANKIKSRRGIDVMAEFNSNEEIKQKVLSGEMDFYEVAEQMTATPKKRPPSPTRSPNGASGKNNPNAIEQMSDEQFAKLEKRISEGARFTLR